MEGDGMKKKRIAMLCAMTVIAATVGGVCTVSAEESQSEEHVITENGAEQTTLEENSDVTEIVLSDDGITVNGEALLEDDSAAVYGGADIVYYKAGQDETYGEGGEEDGHTQEEAAENTVITIAAPGTYRVTGSLSKGQIAVDLGEDAKEDETAVVNLILDEADMEYADLLERS